jgi:uncharacterized repeat protein (TIGR03803 family)
MTTCIKKLLLMAGLGLILARPVAAQTFAVLHSFTGGSDGANPHSGLLLSGSMLYGTAKGGGSSGNGTVFKVNTDGTDFRVLHSFTGTSGALSTNSDGTTPSGPLILSGETLYGTASGGGTSGYGTVFAINTNDASFATLYSFTDWVYQVSGLILSSNTLYGTTDLGGSAGNGSIFALNTNGSGFTTLYSFTALSAGINADGAYPLAPLIVSDNTLYGTAAGGGSSRLGTVFRLNTDGTGFTNLHTFSSDGYDPNAGLILSNNTLFGATTTGVVLGEGTVFRVNTDGAGFSNLYHFGGGNDGGYPGATLLLLGNSLYGSAASGGSSSNGVIFKVNSDGTGFRVLYNFSAAPSGINSDGATPWASLVLSGNVLYGAASKGGSSGNGTLVSISIAPALTITPAAANVLLTWPTNAAGFTLQSTTNLVSQAAWVTNSPEPVVVNGQNTVTNSISGTQQFFRLSQ